MRIVWLLLVPFFLTFCAHSNGDSSELSSPIPCGSLTESWEALRLREVAMGTLPSNSARWFAANKKANTDSACDSSGCSLPPTALVIHGLNHKPSKMDFLADFLTQHGVSSLRITLSGHGGSLDAMKTVSRRKWLNDVAAGYCVALREGNGAPIFLVAFSLGALLALDAENDEEFDFVHFQRSVLFSPAVGARFIGRIPLLLAPFPRLVIPSIGSVEYRANRGTTIAAYSAVWDSVDIVRSRGLKKTNSPMLVFVDKKDELVSVSELEKVQKANPHIDWKTILLEIEPDPSITPKHHHPLITEPRGTGKNNWDLITSEILRHFGLN